MKRKTVAQDRFWQLKRLEEMTDSEWESLCDGCGRCCLHKLEDEDTGEIFFTRMACRLLDLNTCRCARYRERRSLVPDCMDLRNGFTHFHWLPSTCAYRLLAEGSPLPEWHPLISGDPRTVSQAGIAVDEFAIPEDLDADLANLVVEWLF